MPIRLGLVLLAALLAGTPATAEHQRIEPSVVKILVHSNPPDLVSPWQKAGTRQFAGSGVVIEGNRILTNAHVVEDAVHIEVKRAGVSERFVAKVAFAGHECDLALLTVEDERFFHGARPLELGRPPRVQDQVQTYGFPIGGDTISVSSGIISRIEVGTYIHSMEDLLIAQIDASINPGNSGGPVITDGTLAGIAIQSLDEAENVGYMVPLPVIAHFLDDVEDGRYDGFPRLGVELQNLESAALRASLGLSRGQTGALVCRVDHGSPADAVLRPGDVLLEIDGLPVANDRTVVRPHLGRVDLTEVYQAKQIGDRLRMTVFRNGGPLRLEAELVPHQFLVPGRRTEDEPQYLVFGGLVFQPLTLEYLGVFKQPPFDLANHALIQNVVTEQRRQILLIQKVLPHPVNRGYQEWEDYVLDTVNGIVPRDMAHLAEILDALEGPWLRIVTADRSHLTIDLDEARSAHDRILLSFGIARDRSRVLARPTLTARDLNP